MILCIADVLDRAALAALRETLAGGVFVDGVLTSGWASRLVKHNEQLGAGPALERAQEQVIAALSSNPVFAAAALPRRFAPPLLARYTPGMEFGVHMDNAVMGPEKMRSDVSVTLFLSEPGTTTAASWSWTPRPARCPTSCRRVRRSPIPRPCCTG
jgi:PKHD-type hydroxylase